jgi:hypothetical protein
MSDLAILANSETQNTFLFPLHAMFRHDCPLAVRPASTPRRLTDRKQKQQQKLVQKTTWRDFLPIDMLLSAVSVLVVVQRILEVLEGLTNYPVYLPVVEVFESINSLSVGTSHSFIPPETVFLECVRI